MNETLLLPFKTAPGIRLPRRQIAGLWRRIGWWSPETVGGVWRVCEM